MDGDRGIPLGVRDDDLDVIRHCSKDLPNVVLGVHEIEAVGGVTHDRMRAFLAQGQEHIAMGSLNRRKDNRAGAGKSKGGRHAGEVCGNRGIGVDRLRHGALRVLVKAPWESWYLSLGAAFGWSPFKQPLSCLGHDQALMRSAIASSIPLASVRSSRIVVRNVLSVAFTSQRSSTPAMLRARSSKSRCSFAVILSIFSLLHPAAVSKVPTRNASVR